MASIMGIGLKRHTDHMPKVRESSWGWRHPNWPQDRIHLFCSEHIFSASRWDKCNQSGNKITVHRPRMTSPLSGSGSWMVSRLPWCSAKKIVKSGAMDSFFRQRCMVLFNCIIFYFIDTIRYENSIIHACVLLHRSISIKRVPRSLRITMYISNWTYL